MCLVGVQAGDVGEAFAAFVQELFAQADIQFFQCFDAVAGEAGAEDGDVFFAFAGEAEDGVRRVGLEPFGGAEAGLEASGPALCRPAQRFAQQARGFHAMAMVGVAFLEIALGQAVEADDDRFGQRGVVGIEEQGRQWRGRGGRRALTLRPLPMGEETGGGLCGGCAVDAPLPTSPLRGEERWLAFARPARKLKEGMELRFADDFCATVEGRTEDGQVKLRFAEEGMMEKLERYGHMPLPPYIARSDTEADKARYQTIYAAPKGSVAAPTAGLHFTPELMEALEAKGVERAFVTLHVGAGTFQPVKAEDTDDHVMHSEWAEVTAETAARINAVKARGGRIVAVGTTSLRILETASDEAGLLHPYSGETRIFITPGYRFRLVDRLMTNFHLPRSTLFMLVSAFAGLERMQAAYAHAIAAGYRFYSYGDASLLEKA